MDVEFKDLSYTVNPLMGWSCNVTGRCLLKSVSGRFKSGELSAIMGPSGAGKSTLLNAVSGFRTQGVTGKLCTNGKPRDNRLFHKLSCYITQEDVLQPLLTLYELMMVAAKLKLPRHTSEKQRLAVVEEILQTLGLFEYRNTRTERLSGGQKKRLSIALELINNPPVFFLDEPTSGLDNVSTKHVLLLLRTLARQGRTIVCTIHQPSASLFQLFDHVYVVAKGVCVYQGTTKELVPFLSSVGLHCPRHYNPADFVIEVTDGDDQNITALSSAIYNGKLSWTNTHVIQATTEKEEKKYEATTDDSGKQSLQYKNDSNSAIINTENKGDYSSSEGSSSDLAHSVLYRRMSQVKEVDYQTSFWYQFCILLKRMLLQLSRGKVALQLQLIHHIICGFTYGLVAYNNASDGLEMFKHVKFSIGVILFTSYTWCMTQILIFPFEMKLLRKEYFNRWYRLTSFYLAFTISKLPAMVSFSMLFVIIVYFLYGLPIEVTRFFLFFLICIVVGFTAEGLGILIASRFNAQNGCVVGPLVLIPLLGLGVHGIDYADRISWIMHFLMKLSFLRCGIVALILTMFGFDRPDLDCNDVYCHFKKPKVVLRMMDIDSQSVWTELLILLAILVIFRGAGFVLLRLRLKT